VNEPYPEASEWFTNLLNEPCSLLRVMKKKKQPEIETTKSSSSSSSSTTTTTTTTASHDESTSESFSETFSNEAPFLLISSESVDFLNKALTKVAKDRANIQEKEDVHSMLNNDSDKKKKDSDDVVTADEPKGGSHITARNFRPNFVVGAQYDNKNQHGTTDGDEETSSPSSSSSSSSSSSIYSHSAHAEDSWRLISISGMHFEVTGDCSRCAMIEIDPVSGENAASGALRTLASYRRHHADILFGKYLACSTVVAQSGSSTSITTSKQDSKSTHKGSGDDNEADRLVLHAQFETSSSSKAYKKVEKSEYAASEEAIPTKVFELHWIETNAIVNVITTATTSASNNL
jgi:hypothetical protein